MVRGLASLVVECFSEAPPGDIMEFRCSILEASKLEARVTPTRRLGLVGLEAAIHAFARTCISIHTS
jgi:sulfur transfer protein SufE